MAEKGVGKSEEVEWAGPAGLSDAGRGAEAGKGCAGVDLQDISVEVHCAEHDHRQKGGLRVTSPLTLTGIRRGGLCHQVHWGCGAGGWEAWTSCSPQAVLSELIGARRGLGQTELQTCHPHNTQS